MQLENVGSHPGHGAPARPAVSGYVNQPWYQAYMSALFEPDHSQIREKIKSAERLIISREREVFSQPSSVLERNALYRALHALRALEFCQNRPAPKVLGAQPKNEE